MDMRERVVPVFDTGKLCYSLRPVSPSIEDDFFVNHRESLRNVWYIFGYLIVEIIRKGGVPMKQSHNTGIMRSLRNMVLSLLAATWVLMCFGLTGCSSGGGSADAGVAAPPPETVTADTGVAVPSPKMVTADAGNARITLNWTPVNGAAAYNVYYGTQPGVTPKNAQYTAANQYPPFVLRFLPGDVTPLSNGTPYYLVVTAVTAHGESVASKELSATPSATPPPPAPALVRAAAQSGQVALSWEASSGATSYRIYYRTTAGVTTANGTAVPVAAGTSQIVAPLVTGTTYYFIVTAVNAYGESSPSFELSCIPQASSPPSAPTGVTAEEGNGQITLTWLPLGGASSCAIYYATNRNVSKANGIKIANASSPTVMSALSNNQGYYIVVTAANAAGESAESATVAATPVTATPVPQMVRIPGGSFTMGDSLDNTPYCLPVHTVNLETFYIDRYETKYTLWKEVYDLSLIHI